ncbi:MAG: molecular chaperone TorD family protein [Chloroflexi bacterium]|nr:molecular chaperone TorD family protein [Chloroflexota bacterium]
MAIATDGTLCRSALYELFSLAFQYPKEGSAATLASMGRKAAMAAFDLGWQQIGEGLDELSRKLDALGNDGLVEEYVRVFGHTNPKDCPPYEGEYGQSHVFQKSQVLAELSTLYQAFGVQLSPGFKDRPDHVSVELEFMRLLTLKETYAGVKGHGEEKVRLCRSAQESFLSRHLSTWVKVFVGRLAGKAPEGSLYGHLARLLEGFMEREFAAFQLQAAPVSSTSPEAPEAKEEDFQCGA